MAMNISALCLLLSVITVSIETVETMETWRKV
jgi:hypothetical protein